MARRDRVVASLREHALPGALAGVVLAVLMVAAVGSMFVLGITPGRDPGACACSPPTAFTFEESHTGDDVTLTITHDGGDSLSADELYVVVNGESRLWTGHGTASGQRSDASAVIAGDTYRRTGLSEGDTVRLVWRASDSDETVRIAVHTVGGRTTSYPD